MDFNLLGNPVMFLSGSFKKSQGWPIITEVTCEKVCRLPVIVKCFGTTWDIIKND